MKERPILFSLPMVQAILAGNKTQTRRKVKFFEHESIEQKEDGSYGVWSEDTNICGGDFWRDCPHGQVGDRLWVRETYCLGVKDNGEDITIYKASVDDKFNEFRGLWRPSIFMPRKYSRILLEITNVRVERLHHISEQDAIAEGVEKNWRLFTNGEYLDYKLKDGGTYFGGSNAARHSYFSLWESINGRVSLDANPWVWVIEFKVVELRQ